MGQANLAEKRCSFRLPALSHLHLDRDRAPVGVAQRRLEGFGEALLQASSRPDLQAVDHDLDGVLLVAVELGQAVDLVHLAVDAQAHEALGAQLVEELRLLALARRPRAGRAP